MNTGNANAAATARGKDSKTARRTRPAPTPAEPIGGPEMDAGLQELADLSVRYPFRWFPQGKVARICGFGDDVMTALAALGAPVVGRKCNPHLLHKWLEENIGRLGKIQRRL